MDDRARVLKDRIAFCRQLLSRGVDSRQAEALLALVRELEEQLAKERRGRDASS
jgi:hypothetical protein